MVEKKAKKDEVLNTLFCPQLLRYSDILLKSPILFLNIFWGGGFSCFFIYDWTLLALLTNQLYVNELVT